MSQLSMRNGLPYILAAKISFYLINAKLFTNIFLTMNNLSKNNSYRNRRATDTRFYQIIRKTADFQRYTHHQAGVYSNQQPMKDDA